MSIQFKAFDTPTFQSLVDVEAPHYVNAQSKGFTHIDDIDDERVKLLRRLDFSFNLLTNLKNITCQMPQLHHLAAYCCQLQDIEDLSYTNSGPQGSKLEVLHLQQNGISSIPRGFISFTKLRDLRLDRNNLTSVKHLSSCVSLRILNLSYNKLRSIDGIEGLQRLEVLILRNNQIDSIKSIKLLPSLREIDVSFNNLLSLEGVQNFPLIEIIRAENNQIKSLTLPKVFSYSEHTSKRVSTDKSNKNSGQGHKQSSSKGTKSSNSIDTNQQVSMSAVAMGILNHISELLLSNNKLVSLHGIKDYGGQIEILDVSENLFNDELDFLKYFLDSMISSKSDKSLKSVNRSKLGASNDSFATAPEGSLMYNLVELKFQGNPFLNNRNNDSVHSIVRKLLPLCPGLKFVNGYSILFHPDMIAASNDSVDAKDYNMFVDVRNFTLVYQDFHTWTNEDFAITDQSTEGVHDGSEQPTNLSNENKTIVNNQEKKKKSGNESESEEEKEEEESQLMNYNQDRLAPKLHLKNMRSVEEIYEKENSFKNLLKSCKEKIRSISSTTSKLEGKLIDSKDGFKARNMSADFVEITSEFPEQEFYDMDVKVIPGSKKPPLSAKETFHDPLQNGGKKFFEILSTSGTLELIANADDSPDLSTRSEDPRVLLLQQRQLQFTSVASRRASEATVKNMLSDNSSQDNVERSFESKLLTRTLSETDITISPKFSIGFDVRLQKF